MVFYGIGIVFSGLLRYSRRKERKRTEQNTLLLLALFFFGLGIFVRKSQPMEAVFVGGVSAFLRFLFLIAPYVLGFCSVGLLIHAVTRLRERPESRKYWVVAFSGSVMIALSALVLVNARWLQNEWLYNLENTLDYLFVYLFATFLVFLGVAGSSRVLSPSLEKAFIVILGTGLTAEEAISLMLKYRLDKAIQFYENQKAKNVQPATFLVTGGKSPGNSLSEAEVMAAYLTDRGIPEDQIIQENQSINTHQNFLYSQRLLGNGENTVFVTSSYHVLRGNVYARQLGIEAEGIGAKSPLYYLPYALIREYLALFLIYRKVHFVALSLFLALMHVLMH